MLFAGAVLATTGCSSSESPSASGGVPDPGLSHVHGLGINPADGQMYAASHHGVYRLTDGKAEQMGTLIQDTMGFTIAGPDRFLGSGHPDLRDDTILAQDARPLLGLIESTDRAETWRGRSLQGEADFHSLAFAHDRLYGSDSTTGRFLVSTDLKNWETRSHTPLLSVAVSPRDPDRLIGTGAAGAMSSTDGGRTWTPAAGSLALVFVSWHATAGLWGVAGDGSVHQSSDDGASWSQRGEVAGQPAALLADDGGLFAATSTGIYKSSDRGATWSSLYAMQ